MLNMTTRKTRKTYNPVVTTRIEKGLNAEIVKWCTARRIKPGAVLREAIALGWPLFRENPFAVKEQ
jgi:hypothetical protein